MSLRGWMTGGMGVVVSWALPAAAQPSTAATVSADAPLVDPASYDVRDAQRPLFIAPSSLETYLSATLSAGGRFGAAQFSAGSSSLAEPVVNLRPECGFALMSLVTMYAGLTGTADVGINAGTILAHGVEAQGGGYLGLIVSPWERGLPHRERWSLHARVEHDIGYSILLQRALDGIDIDPTEIPLVNAVGAIAPAFADILVPYTEDHVRADLAGADVATAGVYLQGAVGFEWIHRTYDPVLANALTSANAWAAPRLGLALGYSIFQLEYQLTVTATTFKVDGVAQPTDTIIPRTDHLVGLDVVYHHDNLRVGGGLYAHFGVRNDGPLVQEETAPSVREFGLTLFLQHLLF